MPDRNLPPLNTLPAFVVAAKQLSFSKAAEELHVTHSAVSQSIRALEDFLGHQLFLRRAGKVTLTEEGKNYYSAINNAVNIIDEATKRQLGKWSENILTLNVMTTLTMRWLIPRLTSFQERYPKIDLRVSTLGRCIDFVHDRIDVAIDYCHADDWPNMHLRKLFDDRLLLVASPQLIKRKNIELSELIERFKCIYVTATLRKYDWKLWCKAAGIHEPARKNRIYFQSSVQALQAAVSGLGLIVSHEPFIADDIRLKRLSEITKLQIPLDKGYFVVCPKKNLENKSLMNFLDWLINESRLIKAG